VSARISVAIFGLLMSALNAANPTVGQPFPIPIPTSLPGLGDLLADPSTWLMKMFNAALLAVGDKTTGDVVSFMNWLMGAGNVISQTPPALSYSNSAVTELSEKTTAIAFAALAAVIAWGGFNAMVRPHIRAPYHGALELVPRVVLSAAMIKTSLGWCGFVIDLNNELCKELGGASMPGWSVLQQHPGGDSVLLNLIGMAIYLVMGLLLMGQMLMRLALVDALMVIAPLALLCWVLPQTYGWARLWFTTFFGTVFVQAIQVLILRLGAELINRLPSTLPTVGTDALGSGHLWLATLLLGVAVLQLTRKIPRLMPGGASGMGTAPTMQNIVQMSGLFGSGRDRHRGK
jgi:hypothetical protein